MDRDLESVHETLDEAAETASGDVREQLHSIEEALSELGDGDTTRSEPHPRTDRIEELEAKLAGLETETGGATHDRIVDARDRLHAYRRARD